MNADTVNFNTPGKAMDLFALKALATFWWFC
jgi:hypothetical protein